MSICLVLKRLAQNSDLVGGYWSAADFAEVGFDADDSAFAAAANPKVVLTLIAENERLVPFEEAYQTACNVRNRLIKENELQDRLIVENKAISDSFLAERDQLKAENEALRGLLDRAWYSDGNICTSKDWRDQYRAAMGGGDKS